jgi:hypothetical protein
VRKILCFLLALLVLGPIEITAKESDSFVIRRAYIDVIGVVPTTQEIEWYCVYNNDGYNLALDWLMNHKDYGCNGHIIYTKEFLMSREYKNSPKVKIEKKQVYKNLLYVTGIKEELSLDSISKAQSRLIQNAIACGDGDTEIIDYMCNALMSRDSNLKEANKLTKIIKESNKNELDTWMDVLNEILKFEDVNSK